MMRKLIVLGLAIGLLAFPGLASAQQGFGAPPAKAAVAEPTSLDDALVVISAGDIAGFIETLGPVTSKVQPTLTADSLRAMLGMQLKDQELAGLPKGAGAALVIFPPGRAVGFIEVAPSQLDKYMGLLQTQGSQVTKASGLLVVTDAPQHLALGTQFAPEVSGKLLAGAGKPTLKVFVNMPKVLPVIEPAIRGFLDMIEAFQPQAQPQGPGAAATAPSMQSGQMRILRAEALGILAMAKQIEAFTIEAMITNENIQVVSSLKAIAGSEMATVFAAPTPSVRALSRVLPSKGVMRGTLSFNNDAAVAFAKSISETVGKEMDLTDDEKTGIDKYLELVNIYSGAMAFDMFIPDAQVFSGSFIYGVKDEKKALAAYAGMNESMKTFLKMYEEMGMPMKMNFMPNVRTHRNTPIHKFTMDMTMPPETPKEMKVIMETIIKNFTYNMAIKNKMLLSATDGVSIEELIDAFETGSHASSTEMNSRKVFGSGAKMYMDFDVSGLVKFISGVVKQFQPEGAVDPTARFVQILSDIEPIAMAGFWGNGPEAKFGVSIPADLIAKGSAGAVAASQMANTRRSSANANRVRPIPTSVEGKVAYAKSDLRTIATGLEAHFVDNNKYPAKLDELIKPISYLQKIPVDPFSPNQSTYKYALEGTTYRIWSVGPDGNDNGGTKEYDQFNNNDKTGDIVRKKQ